MITTSLTFIFIVIIKSEDPLLIMYNFTIKYNLLNTRHMILPNNTATVGFVEAFVL